MVSVLAGLSALAGAVHDRSVEYNSVDDMRKALADLDVLRNADRFTLCGP
jgi:hypothetical protein